VRGLGLVSREAIGVPRMAIGKRRSAILMTFIWFRCYLGWKVVSGYVDER
jgi:hypothetical protein